jgi:hypothetical protein
LRAFLGRRRPPDVLPASAAGKSPFDDTQVTPTG